MDMIEVGPIRIPYFPVKVWPFLPSWPDSAAEPEIETSYLTEVIKSRSGKEQRSASRQWPRYRMRYERILWGEEYRVAKMMLQTGKHHPWYFMRVGRDFRLTDTISIGDQNAVVLDDAPAWCSEGRVLIFTDGTRFEAQIIVADNGANSFDFIAAFTEAWGVGTRVYAGLVGYFADNTALRKETSQVARLTVEVEDVAGANVPDEVVTAEAPGASYYLAAAHLRSPRVTVAAVNDWNVVPDAPSLSSTGYECDFSPNGRFLAVSQSGGPRIAVIDTSDWSLVSGVPEPPGTSYGCAFSPGSDYLAIAHFSSPYLTVLRTADWSVVPDTPTLPNDGYSCSFSPDGAYLAVGLSSSPNLLVIRTSDWSVLPGTPDGGFSGDGCAFSPNGDYLAEVHFGGDRLTVFSTADWSVIPGTPALSGRGWGCAFSPDSAYLALAHENGGRLTVLDTSDWSAVSGTPTLPGTGRGCAFSRDGRYLAVAHRNSPYLTVLNTTDWSVVSGTPTLSDIGFGVAFSPNLTPVPPYEPGFLLRPNWAEQVDATMQSPADRVDFDHGVVDRQYPEFTRETWQYTYLSRNREDSLLVNQKFTELRGRLTETYLPTWDADFLPRTGTTASASVIRVQGQYFYTSNTHNALFIESDTGEQWSVGVASYTEVNDAQGADTWVTLDTPLPQAITGEQIKRISWLMRARLANDTLTETFLTDSVSNIVLNIQTLDDPAAT